MSRFAAALLAMWLADNGGQPMRLGDADLMAAFSGKTIAGSYSDGVTFSESYRTDGSLSYTDVRGPADGQWFVRNGLFCTFYEDLKGGCFAVEKRGRNCFDFLFITSLPDEGAAAGERPRFTARGAATDAPSTCPDLLQS